VFSAWMFNGTLNSDVGGGFGQCVCRRILVRVAGGWVLIGGGTVPTGGHAKALPVWL
jgi:hypothetical protein